MLGQCPLHRHLPSENFLSCPIKLSGYFFAHSEVFRKRTETVLLQLHKQNFLLQFDSMTWKTFAVPKTFFSCTWNWHRWPCRKNHCKEHLLTSFWIFNMPGLSSQQHQALRKEPPVDGCNTAVRDYHLDFFFFFAETRLKWSSVSHFFFFHLSLREHFLECSAASLFSWPAFSNFTQRPLTNWASETTTVVWGAKKTQSL